MRFLIKAIRFILPVIVLGGCVLVAWWLLSHPPEQKKMEMPPTLVRVEGTVLNKTSYDLRVRSQGTVQPRTTSTLLPEVSGKIIEISPSFRPGGFFGQGDVLMRLDPLDYETAIVISKAALAQAEVMLAEEKARADQAVENWRAMGRTGTPSALVTRTPQLAKAEADVASTKAQVIKAERDLERTTVRAPYACQVLEQAVDIGQFVGQGTILGRIFAVDYVEIRLPLPERESQFLKLPQSFSDQSTASVDGATVYLKSVIAGKPVAWEGKIVRVEGSLDAETRQSTAVAQVTDPYARRADGSPPLTIGAFVEAEIAGEPLQDVYIIPRNAVRAGNEIILIDQPQNTLRRMTVEPMVSNEDHIVVSASAAKAPKPGDILCLTPIPFPADGARVVPTIDGKNPPGGEKKAKPEPKPKLTQAKPTAT
ncbi:RND family efflux transporter MFP subunit [Prosthecobacter fusiformis]|uniref:RND family efflux transporter MFP subunit n=1 Tax=Prosthecobacter fusiformis TaxID=48464 RepID=A0A4R7RIN6_9BACT|nr:efflux RND transporter periplasmic adaptor subunit [Prosthecobacter fusiformis]TDU63207.1 RND family efflux transporter MFP subunit [Prosthecobacter fusiformis]